MLVQDLDPGLSHIATAITITELRAITNVFISFELKEDLMWHLVSVKKLFEKYICCQNQSLFTRK